MSYNFSVDWFSRNEPSWNFLLERVKPRRYLEIGSYEGRSATFVTKKCNYHSDLHIYCIDTWEGGVEHDRESMGTVEQRFDNNISLAISEAPSGIHLNKIKGYSGPTMIKLLASEEEKFDFIYIDGSHQAADVLLDSVLAFNLLRVGGMLVFDDYTWSMEPAGAWDLNNSPKLAIDSFINCYIKKLSIINLPLYQVYLQKIKD